MFRKTLATLVWTAILLASHAARTSGAPPQTAPSNTSSGPIICSVMETFEDTKLGVRAVIFHQRDKADGPRLGSLCWHIRVRRWNWKQLQASVIEPRYSA